MHLAAEALSWPPLARVGSACSLARRLQGQGGAHRAPAAMACAVLCIARPCLTPMCVQQGAVASRAGRQDALPAGLQDDALQAGSGGERGVGRAPHASCITRRLQRRHVRAAQAQAQAASPRSGSLGQPRARTSPQPARRPPSCPCSSKEPCPTPDQPFTTGTPIIPLPWQVWAWP